MGRNNEFNLLSLNVRGIRTFENRKAVFSWLVNSDADINGKLKCSSRMAAIIAEVF